MAPQADWFAEHAPQAPPAVSAPPVGADGRPRVSSNLSDAPDSAISQWFEQHLRPALESAAHPHTLDDVAGLLLAPTDATRGYGAALVAEALDKLKTTAGAVKSAAKASSAAAVRTAAAFGDAIDPDVVGVISPRAGKVLSLAQRLRDKMATPKAAGPAGTPAAASAPTAPATASSGSAPSAPLALTDEEWRAMRDLVSQGYQEADVLRTIREHRATAPPPAAPPSAPAVAPADPGATPAAIASATKPSLVAAEAKEYLRLTKAGKSPAEAMELIEAQRGLTKRLGLRSAETVRQSVVDRNATGHWRGDE